MKTTISRLALFLALIAPPAHAVIRDGGIDPANLGKGDWIYSIQDATNKLGGHITSVTNENSLFLYYKSIGVRYVIVKTGTAANLYNACYGFPQLSTNFIAKAHANGVWVFGYNRNYGSNVLGEVAIANFAFNQGADGFVFDAEAEFESGALGTDGPSLAWQQCSQVRSNWPNKFLAHAPFPIIYLHSTFPYKEFGFWCDAVMPQIYHFSSTGIKGSPSAAINWSDVNWKTWQDSLYSLPATNINGVVVNWTNSIKPIVPLQDVYGAAVAGGVICNSTTTAQPDEDVLEFIDYCAADPNAQTAGGYQGVNFWRADLHSAAQYNHIKNGTAGSITGVVNNIVLDDRAASFVGGGWTHVRVFGATTTTPTYYGATGTDTNSFGTNYFSRTQGAGTSYAQFTPNVLVGGDYDLYEWHPYVTNASAATPFAVTHAFGTTNVFSNQRTNPGTWSRLGRFTFAAGTGGNIRVMDNFSDTGNLAIADGLKLVFVSSNAPTAPVISQPPTNQTVIAGQGVALAVSASGSAPLTYQWRRNGANLPGATSSTLNYPVAHTNLSGTYTVVITNTLGSVTSAPAILTVNYSLAIAIIGGGSVAPATDTSGYTPGSPLALTATPLPGYTFSGWTGDIVSAANPLNFSFATNTSLTATFLNTNTDLILDNTNSEVVFTAGWTLTTSSTDKYLADYRFASSAAGGTLTATYRPAFANAGFYDVFIWYPQGGNRPTNAPWAVFYDGGSTNVAVDQTINGGGWRLIAAARPFQSGTNGYVLLSNDTGYSGKVVMADGVRFTYAGPLNTPPVISQQPQSRIVKTGSNVLFSVTASGVPAPGFQWKFFGTNLPGETGSNYTRLNAQPVDAGHYSVLVSNIAGGVLSSNALLTVNPWLPVVFQSVTAQPGGAIAMSISGNAGENLYIDRTTNLPPAWNLLATLFNTNGSLNYTDTTASNLPQSFYRARQ